MRYSSYPRNDWERRPGMHPSNGKHYPEEIEVDSWLKNISEYEFADLSAEADYDWRNWRHWAVAMKYIYDDYAAWKRKNLYSPWDLDAPHLLQRRQFSIVLRMLMPDINFEAGSDLGFQRRTVIERLCPREGRRKNVRVLRGVKHPEAFHIGDARTETQ